MISMICIIQDDNKEKKRKEKRKERKEKKSPRVTDVLRSGPGFDRRVVSLQGLFATLGTSKRKERKSPRVTDGGDLYRALATSRRVVSRQHSLQGSFTTLGG
mmetsp:Transcript_10238/g.16738  ORF Transcript_10238/g.16738 Transcript_10238/m.16738 type:complete len:102 (+) Transcript_10238:3151-3456(+)